MEKVLYEAADIARLLGLTPAAIRYHIRAGRLRVARRTRRGGALFTAKELAEFRKRREATQSGRD